MKKRPDDRMQRETGEKKPKQIINLKELCDRLGISEASGRGWIRRGLLMPVDYPDIGGPLFLPEEVLRAERALSRKDGRLRSRRNKSRLSSRTDMRGYLTDDSPNRERVRQFLSRWDQMEETVMKQETSVLQALANCARQLSESAGHTAAREELIGDLTGRMAPAGDGDTELAGDGDTELAGGDSAQRECDGCTRPERDDSAECAGSGSTMPARDGGAGLAGAGGAESPGSSCWPHLSWQYIAGEDVLGFLYQSLRDPGKQRSSGSYFTPWEVAGQVVESAAPEKARGIVLDPCCGSGQFLIRIPDEVSSGRIRGMDIDETAVRIARINLSLRRPDMTAEQLRSQIICGNFLDGNETDQRLAEGEPSRQVPAVEEAKIFDSCGSASERRHPRGGISPGNQKRKRADVREDCGQEVSVILGNPPWGAAFREEERRRLRERYPELFGRKNQGELPRPESADLFLAESVRKLAPGGTVTFLLPESVLMVQLHRRLRQHLLEEGNITRAAYLGACFPGISCPVVLLTFRKAAQEIPERHPRSLNTAGTAVVLGEEKRMRTYLIRENREFSADRFPFHLTDEEWHLVRHLRSPEKKQYLAGHADFALGIVTGRNRDMLLDHPRPDAFPVRRGADIACFSAGEPSRWLRAGDAAFQQAAPEELYLAPEKLIYRFISRSPVFALDRSRMRTINSANLLIPHLPGMPAAALEACLNSRVIRFLYEKELRSVKLLRRHIEEFPLPRLSRADADRAAEMAEQLRAIPVNDPMRRRLYDVLDQWITARYGLTEQEYELLCRSLGEEVPFL